MEKNMTTINILPSPTWTWLDVNTVTIENIDAIGSVTQVNLTGKEDTFKLPLCHEVSQRDCVDIKTAQGIKGTVIIDHTSKGKGICAGLTLNFDLKKDSEITIVQVVRLDDADSLISGFVGTQQESSRLNIIQVFTGGRDVYANIINDLSGKGSFFDLKSAYRLYEKNNLDINYVVNHIAPDTECALDSKGVLYRGAKKIYRGTIDFKRGCKGAVGNETEDVLLMDSDIINKSVPVILCAEEDVEGNHGATIGKVSDELMFYLLSRGIPEKDVYDMLAKGRIESVIKYIPDDELKEALLKD